MCVDESGGGDAGPGLAGMLGGDDSGEIVHMDGDVELDDEMEGGEGDNAATAETEHEAAPHEGEDPEAGAEDWYHDGEGEGEGAEFIEETGEGEGEYVGTGEGEEYAEETGGEAEEIADSGVDEDLAE